jgi:hypothetical protein
MGDSWDDCASTWNDDEIVNSYCDKAYESLTRSVKISDCISILDFGCGTVILPQIKEYEQCNVYIIILGIVDRETVWRRCKYSCVGYIRKND